MKIVCEACGQRYAISDQKVVGPGRVFKVTCRQCSHGIIVRGISEEVASVSDEWHYVVGRERRGPVDRETIAQMVYEGSLDERTYLWASGMDEWIRFKDVPGMNHLLEAAPRASDAFEPSDTTLIPEDELQAAQLSIRGDLDIEDTPAIPDFHSTTETDEPQEPHEATTLISVADLEAAHSEMLGTPEQPEGGPDEAEERPASDLSPELEEAFSLDEGLAAQDESSDGEETTSTPDEDATPDEDEVVTDPKLAVGADTTDAVTHTQTEMEMIPHPAAITGADTAEVISSVPVINEEDANTNPAEVDDIFPDEEEEGGGVHQRHDTSVLFSLDDLSREQQEAEADLDPFLTEGSGLIDLKSLSSTRGKGASAGQPGDASGPGVMGRPSAGTRPVDVPLIQSRQVTLPLIVGGAIALLCVGGLGGWLVARQVAPSPPATAVAVGEAPDETPSSGGETTAGVAAGEAIANAGDQQPEPKTDAEEAKPPEGAEEAKAPEEIAEEPKAVQEEESPDTGEVKAKPPETRPAVPTPEEKKPRAPERAAQKEVKSKAPPAKVKKPVSPPQVKTPPAAPKKKAPPEVVVEPDPAPVKRKSASNTSDVNSLLNQLNKKKGSASKDAAPAADPNLPAKLGASAVRGTLKKRHGVFRACYKKMVNPAPGGALVKTSFVIKGSGTVSMAQILAGAGTNAAVQSCLVKALKATRFPRFRDPQMTVNYPISLR